MNLPPVEWDPKRGQDQRSKFEAAFDHVWDYRECKSEDDVRRRPRAGESPAHVIDLVTVGRTTGIRIIASRELQPAGELCHVSISIHHTDLCSESELGDAVSGLLDEIGFIRMGSPFKIGATGMGVSHFFFEVPGWIRERIKAVGEAQ